MVEGIADAFATLISRYSRFFRTRTRDSAAVAERYLSGLAQAEVCKFVSMAAVVESLPPGLTRGAAARSSSNTSSATRRGTTNRSLRKSVRTRTVCLAANRRAA